MDEVEGILMVQPLRDELTLLTFREITSTKQLYPFFYEYKAYLKYAYLSFSIFSMLRIVWQILSFTEHVLVEKRKGREKGFPEFLLDLSGYLIILSTYLIKMYYL